MKLISCLALVVVSLLLSGCNVDRKLKVTEIVAKRVELFLDEPSDQELQLTGIKLKWGSRNPDVTGELDLGLAGPLRGQQFLVIFEDEFYMGAPIGQPFRPTTPGIKVKKDFFPNYRTGTSVSMGVSGENARGVFFVVLYHHKADDVVRFGPRPRPPLAGVFIEDGSLDAVRPEGGRESVSRIFLSTGPRDTDSESDWSLRPESIGVPTPP